MGIDCGLFACLFCSYAFCFVGFVSLYLFLVVGILSMIVFACFADMISCRLGVFCCLRGIGWDGLL